MLVNGNWLVALFKRKMMNFTLILLLQLQGMKS